MVAIISRFEIVSRRFQMLILFGTFFKCSWAWHGANGVRLAGVLNSSLEAAQANVKLYPCARVQTRDTYLFCQTDAEIIDGFLWRLAKKNSC